VDLSFRQESNFLYLTGVEEPEFYFAMDVKTQQTMLFVPFRDTYYAVWNGIIETPEQIQAKYGVDAVYYSNTIDAKMTSITNNKTRIVYIIPGTTFQNMDTFKLDKSSLLPIISSSRGVKTQSEIALLRVAATVSSDAHIVLMKDCRPDLFEFNLGSFFLYYTGSCSLEHQAYLPIVGSGNHSAILHYQSNKALMQDGQFVLVDAGAEYMGYGSDITRTYPVNGKFSLEQKLIYEMVLNIVIDIESKVKPGVSFYSLYSSSYSQVCSQLLQGGFLIGTVPDLVSNGICALFYPHGLGHSVGIDVHDPGMAGTLQEGNVLTIEPGIYFIKALLEPAMADPVKAKFLQVDIIKKLLEMNFGGVRIEDDVLVTKTGMELLSPVPKTVAEIEALMSQKK